MSVNQSYPTGYVDTHCFRRVNNEFFIYHSPIRHREYELHLIDGEWQCNCPDKRHNNSKCCKHEQTLSRLWEQHQARKSLSMRQAEAVASKAEREAEQQAVMSQFHTYKNATEMALTLDSLRAMINLLRDEDAALREQLMTIKQTNAPDLTAIMAEIETLKAENAEIKRMLATKATARRKHQSEQEAAELKRDMNLLFQDVVEAANTAIQTTDMLKERLADLEAIPHALKEELDRQAEAGKEELQPDYKAPDYNAPEVKAAVREAQEADRKRRKRHENSRLGEGVGFSLLK